ncbi:aminotransferase class I/II-fold pyridoxal phosphate-dependent enzyme [Rhizobium leucaenae]|uniref:7-keto-8-aminopelargonate synthetase-like enzyme n=1 Tax=Rhizobium leucaenae TaxID=29450 RepID=A0A7W6ZZI5_9HYPH|nr:aminotransferase class I/II-fold pyridoxal phosphate-dependent enzyme [Rhizobium leucaenae]MBB4571152.1 7-keto-8-aminopelargonate synthetase-like enzyme [Rhizobium leucaenae]MBB6304115.1 7-keto-8-aminopelargonate synthetase-like enzyme [Rhizobium leucaenae]
MSDDHQSPTAAAVQRSYRNTLSVIDFAERNLAAAEQEGLMALYAKPSKDRSVFLPTVSHDRKVIDFVRCSYLGLDNHPRILEGAVQAVRQHNALHWSCARTRLNFGFLGELEEALSDLFAARVITYTTVLAANMGALPLLASGHLTENKRPTIVFDRLAHATLAFHKPVAACETQVETIAHNDLNTLEDICRRNDRVAYVCDGAYSMGGSAPIADLLTLQDRYGLFLYIDDAHGISLFGTSGEGFARSQLGPNLGERTIIAASLGKGFGASGGLLMLGTSRQEQLFRRFSVAYAFSASLNLAAIGAAMASQSLHRTEELKFRQDALARRIIAFDRKVASEQAGSTLPIRTIEFGDENSAIRAARRILNKGFFTSVIFFPTIAKDKAGLRICVTASHTMEDIEGLSRAIREAREEQGSN